MRGRTVSLARFASAIAQEKGPSFSITSDLILDRFSIVKNGDFLLVPVRLAGKDHLYAVDTGATNTVIDTSVTL